MRDKQSRDDAHDMQVMMINSIVKSNDHEFDDWVQAMKFMMISCKQW